MAGTVTLSLFDQAVESIRTRLVICPEKIDSFLETPAQRPIELYQTDSIRYGREMSALATVEECFSLDNIQSPPVVRKCKR
jgi:hypothetical protein